VTTPALSTNYLRVRIPGVYPANIWLNVRITTAQGNYVVGEPEASDTAFVSEYSAHSASLR
jgi:hypothetical protein